VNSLPKTVSRQRRDCDLNAGPSAPESNTLSTRLPSHPGASVLVCKVYCRLCRAGRWSESSRVSTIRTRASGGSSSLITWRRQLNVSSRSVAEFPVDLARSAFAHRILIATRKTYS